MKEKKNIWTKWLYWFMFAVAVISVYKTLDNFNEIGNWFRNFFNIIMPFLIGILIAYLLYIPAKKIENKRKKNKIEFISKRSRGISIFIVYVVAISIIALIIRFIIPVIAQSVMDLINNFQNYYNILLEKYNNLPEESIIKSKEVATAIEQLKNIDFTQYINMSKLTEYAKGVINIANGIFDAFVTFIVSIYILAERTQIRDFIKNLNYAIFGEKTAKNINKYFERTNDVFLKFLGSQFLDAIVVAILVSIAMGIMKVKYAVLLGFMIGLFNMIPYFGAIIAVIISGIITILTGGIAKAIIMVIIVTILQQIDANIINPKIVGDSLKISPLLVIFAVTLGGAYFGILGMFLAVPVMAVMKILVIDYIEYKKYKRKNMDVH